MIIAQKVDGAWQQVSGLITIARLVTAATLNRLDGSSVPVEVDPYPVNEQLDVAKIAGFVALGVWGAEDLALYGLAAGEDLDAIAAANP